MTPKLQALLYTARMAATAVAIGTAVALSSIYISEFWTTALILLGLFLFLLSIMYQNQLSRIQREREEIIRHLKD